MRRLALWNLMTPDGCFEGGESGDRAFHPIARGDEMQRFSRDQASTADPLRTELVDTTAGQPA